MPNRTSYLASTAEAIGTIIIVATYLYLVVGQPTEIAESSFSQSGLIAIAGYVIGAILLEQNDDLARTAAREKLSDHAASFVAPKAPEAECERYQALQRRADGDG